MELINKNNHKISFIASMNISLANAIRRTVVEIPVLAIRECDFYKNDSALYDEMIAQRLGLVPLKNQKLKKGEIIELKMKAKGAEGGIYVMSGELGDMVVFPDMPIVYLDKGQSIEIVARVGMGDGQEHAKFIPGLFYYKNLSKIKINKEGESLIELSKIYPEIFEFKDKLMVKDASKCELDTEDLKNYPGVEITFDNKLVFDIETWGQMSTTDIFLESCKTLKSNLSEVSKLLK